MSPFPELGRGWFVLSVGGGQAWLASVRAAEHRGSGGGCRAVLAAPALPIPQPACSGTEPALSGVPASSSSGGWYWVV